MAKNEDIPVAADQREDLADQYKRLTGSVLQLKPNDPKRAQANIYIEKLREKSVGLKDSLDKMKAATGELDALLIDDDEPITNDPDAMHEVMQYVGVAEQSLFAISYCLGARCDFMTVDLKTRLLVLLQKIPTLFTSETMGTADDLDTHMARTDKCLQEATIVLPLETAASDSRSAFSAIMRSNDAGKEPALCQHGIQGRGLGFSCPFRGSEVPFWISPFL